MTPSRRKVSIQRKLNLGFTLVELMIGLGVCSILTLISISYFSQVSLNVHSHQQKSEFMELVTTLRSYLKVRQNCTLNLAGKPFGAGATLPLASINLVNHGALSSTSLVSAGSAFPNASGLIKVNPNNAAAPGMQMNYKGVVQTNSAQTMAAFAAELIISAQKLSTPGGSPIGSVAMTDRVALTVTVDDSGLIQECFAPYPGEDMILLKDEICAVSGGPASYYDVASGNCKSNCFSGSQTQASCPVPGSKVVSCSQSGAPDPSAGSYKVGRDYIFPPGWGNNAVAVKAKDHFDAPPGYVRKISDSSCGCVWAMDAGAGLCQACCSVSRL